MDDQHRIEHLVTVAARDNSGAPRVELFRALKGVEMFYAATEVVGDGRNMMSTPLRKLNDGSTAMLVYTSKRHPDLPQKFAGTQWSTVLKIAHEALRSDWLVIIGRNNDTVAISRDQLPIIIADLEEAEAGHLPAKVTPVHDLESSISNAVNTGSDDWYESALVQLRGREVYLHLTDEVSPDGRPSLLTSAAGGREGWILSYTTRKRPGVKYGGIKWEELVKMIKSDTEIPGVRIVNDADDWIILGRDLI